jgi:oligopeptidase B
MVLPSSLRRVTLASAWSSKRLSSSRQPVLPAARNVRCLQIVAGLIDHRRARPIRGIAGRSSLLASVFPVPPVARRDEERVVYAGVAPKGWNIEEKPRQSESSTEVLLDPPVPIPDPYGWLRDDNRTSEEVIAHLHAENNYTEAISSHLVELRASLYAELLASIQETDYTTPRPRPGDYFYYKRTFEGQPYVVHCRAPRAESTDFALVSWDGKADSPILPGEEIVLDVNKLAAGHSYCSTGSVATSPSHKYLAYTADFSGDEAYLLFVKNLASNQIVDHDSKLEIGGAIVWGPDDTILFYLTLDKTKRPYRVYRRRLLVDSPGASKIAEEDELLFEELDEMFSVGIGKTLDGRYLLIETSSKETSEVHFLDLQDPTSKLQCVARRRTKVLYEVDHRDGYWWILGNVGNLPNFALFVSPAVAESADQWTLVADPGNDNALFDGSVAQSLDSVTCFRRHVAIEGRKQGLPRVWVLSVPGPAGAQPQVDSCQMLSFPEEACSVCLGAHYEYDVDRLVVEYDSLVTPPQSLAIRMDDVSDRIVLKERVVPNYSKDDFASERTTVLSRDGKTQIPISIVYRRDVMMQHLASNLPLFVHLYGYGSYGACVEADFSSSRLPLLNRGVVYAIAHVRGMLFVAAVGTEPVVFCNPFAASQIICVVFIFVTGGGEMGRQWYEGTAGGDDNIWVQA